MNLSIKNAPDDLVRRLKSRAERNHRSLQGELMAIIEAAAYATLRKAPHEIFDDGGNVHAQDESVVLTGWPPQVREWRGFSEMPPFESYRDEFVPPDDDGFS